MRTLLRPRLASIDTFAGALLVALGVQLQAGCGGNVTVEGTAGTGAEGGGGSGGAGSSSTNGTGAGNATSSTGTTGTTTSSSSNVGGAGGGSGDCVNPMPYLVNGKDVGIDVCAGGQLRRRAAIECPTNYPDTNPCCGECPAGTVCDDGGEWACSCVAACTSDSQCAPDQLCLCGEAAGMCTSASCKTGADCGTGGECTSWDPTMGCYYIQFACTTPNDTCGGDLDCSAAPNSYCTVQPDGHRECVQGGCAIGRPFLVEGEARTAPLARRNDWCQADLSPSLLGMNDAVRDELATAWEHAARMEHASIAAFARFSLQLLSLGAPAGLIERTNSALVDETRHARAAFALASAYRGRRLGPGPLSADGALDGGNDVASIVRLVIREGCAGETIAAVEAGEAEANAKDPVVRALLAGIANDESEHAELAWRTVRWALATFGGEVQLAIRSEIAILQAELHGARHDARPRSSRDEVLLHHGVVTSELRQAMREVVLRRAVLPCLKALVEEALPLAA